MPFNPGVIEIDGQSRPYREWLREYANAGDGDGLRRLMRKTLLANPAASFDPAQVRVHAERIVGLTAPQAAWAENLFSKLLGDRSLALAINQRNNLVPLRDAMQHARSMRLANHVESMQVGPQSVILAEVEADATRDDVEAIVNSLQAAFGATVIVKPKDIEFRRMSVQDLVKLRDRLQDLIPVKFGGNKQPAGGGGGRRP
jgi:hypothetical protein